MLNWKSKRIRRRRRLVSREVCVLQCIAVCLLQCVAECCGVLRRRLFKERGMRVQYAAVCCSALRCVAVRLLQGVAVCCSVLRRRSLSR